MTRHNLEVHLKWLLQQGPSLYPSLSPSARDSRNSIREYHTQNRPTPALHATGNQVPKIGIGDSQPLRNNSVDNADKGFEVESDEDMARLLLAPQSASKPRLFSRPTDAVNGSPSKPNVRTHAPSPTRQWEARKSPAIKSMVIDLLKSFRTTND